MKICKCRDKRQAGHMAQHGTTELGNPILKVHVTDHHVNTSAASLGRPEFYENARGEVAMSFRLFREASFEALCAHLCGGRLSKVAS